MFQGQPWGPGDTGKQLRVPSIVSGQIHFLGYKITFVHKRTQHADYKTRIQKEGERKHSYHPKSPSIQPVLCPRNQQCLSYG